MKRMRFLAALIVIAGLFSAHAPAANGGMRLLLKREDKRSDAEKRRLVTLLVGLLKRDLAHKAGQKTEGTFLHDAFRHRAAELEILEGMFHDERPVTPWSTATPFISEVSNRLFKVDPDDFDRNELVEKWKDLLAGPNLVSVVPTTADISDRELIEGVLHGVHPGWIAREKMKIDGGTKGPLQIFTHDVGHARYITNRLLNFPDEEGEVKTPTVEQLDVDTWLSVMHGQVVRLRVADAIAQGLKKIERQESSWAADSAANFLGDAVQLSDGFPESLVQHLQFRRDMSIWVGPGKLGYTYPDRSAGLVELIDSMAADPRLRRPDGN